MDADSPGNVVFKSHHRLIKFSIYFYLLFLLTYFFGFGWPLKELEGVRIK